MTAAPVTLVLMHYFPEWTPPADTREWNACLCPVHTEEHPSAAVSYQNGAIKCHACGFKGNITSIIMQKDPEVRNYQDAIRRAEVITQGSYTAVSQGNGRKPRRRVFGVTRNQ